MDAPETRYAKTADGVRLAYQVVGEGPADLVYVPGWVTHLELFWESPAYASFLKRLASFSRVVLFDKRGTGLSDRVPVDRLPRFHDRMDDVLTVMDAVDVGRAALFGVSEGGPIAIALAVEHPERTSAVITFGGFPRFLQADDYPWGYTRDSLAQATEALERVWQDAGDTLRLWAPSVADDEGTRRWWARYLRTSASPSAGSTMTRMNAEIDIRAILPTVSVPTLIMHRTGDWMMDVEGSRLTRAWSPEPVSSSSPARTTSPSGRERRTSSTRSRSS
jgi:pimeloyl-ACP methyl ester carboxylesterase